MNEAIVLPPLLHAVPIIDRATLPPLALRRMVALQEMRGGQMTSTLVDLNDRCFSLSYIQAALRGTSAPDMSSRVAEVSIPATRPPLAPPIVVNGPSGVVLAGHAEVARAVGCGLPAIDVLFVAITPDNERRVLAAVPPIVPTGMLPIEMRRFDLATGPILEPYHPLRSLGGPLALGARAYMRFLIHPACRWIGRHLLRRPADPLTIPGQQVALTLHDGTCYLGILTKTLPAAWVLRDAWTARPPAAPMKMDAPLVLVARAVVQIAHFNPDIDLDAVE